MAATKNTKAFYNTEIPSDWKVVKLGRLGFVVSGLTYSPDDISEENGVLVLRSSNIQGGRITFDDNVFVKVKEGDFNPVKKNDILICVRNGSKSLIGKCALINENVEGVAFGAFMAIFRGDFNEYLIHVFNTDIYNREIHRNLGATINSINVSDLKEFKIPLPPLPEQKAIAACLSTWDEAISKTQALIAQKELRKKWLMQQLLSEKRIVKNEKWCKSGMKRVELNELGKIVSGGTPDTTVGEYWGGSINWVTPTDITALKGSKYLYDTKRKITEKGLKNSSAEIIPIDSIVITSRATIGEIAINKEPITTNQGFKSIIPNPQKVNTEYLYYLLQTKKHQLIALGSGSTFFEVSKTDIFHFSLFIVNSIEEQTAIAQVLQAVDKEISLLKAKVEKLKEQKKGLMQILLTGKVRLKIN